MIDRSRTYHVLLAITACLLLFYAAPAWAGDEDEDEGPGPDPYTKEKPQAIKAAGYLRYGPFSLTETHTTEDVEGLIGAKWMLWVETRHFKIGSTLGIRPIVVHDRDASKRLEDEVIRLRKKLPRISRKARELDEWLTVHLFAQRLEELYADLADRFAVKERPGATSGGPEAGGPEADDPPDSEPYTGWRNKFIVIFFEQKGNLARYLARYVGVSRDSAYRHMFPESNTMVFATSREHFNTWPDVDTAFYCHMTANLVHACVSSYGGYKYRLPLWWGEGLTHWYVRRINPEFFNPTTAQDQKFDYRRDYEWEKKVYGRIKNDYYRPARELITFFEPEKMDFADHMMSWSRVDYLLTLGNEKTGKYMQIMKSLPWVAGTGPEDVLALQEKALREAWGLDPDGLDKKWTAWVLKKYKNVKKGRRK